MDHREALKAIARAIESKDLRALKEFEELFSKYHFKYLYDRLRRGDVRMTSVVGDYVIVKFGDREEMIIVMFDETTERFYVDVFEGPLSHREVSDVLDVYMLLGYNKDATLMEEIVSDGLYRVQGDLVMAVASDGFFIDELGYQVRRRLESMLEVEVARRVASALMSELGLHAGVRIVGWRPGESFPIMVNVEIPLPRDRRRLKRRAKELEPLVSEFRKLIERHLDELLGDVVRFMQKASGAARAYIRDVSDGVLIVIDDMRRGECGSIGFYFSRVPDAIEIGVHVHLDVLDALLNEVLGRLRFEAHTLNIGNHTVTITGATGNQIVFEIDTRVGGLQRVRLEALTQWILVRDAEVLIHHPEHGVKLLRVRGTKSVRFETTHNGIGAYVNRYILQRLRRKYERQKRRGER